MKKVIIITTIVCIIIGITVIFFLPKTDTVFYIENPALKLSNLNGHITDIFSLHDNYAIIMGYSEYPLVIRKDRGAHLKITVNSEGTEFTAYTELDDKEVFFLQRGRRN